MQSSHWWAGRLLLIQIYGPNYKSQHGSSHTMAQAVTHSLTTEAQSHTICAGFVMDRVAVGHGFLQGLWFSYYYSSTSDPYSFHSSTPNTMKY